VAGWPAAWQAQSGEHLPDMEHRFNAAALPPIDEAARQEYEYFGSTLTTNTALKITVIILAGVIAVLSFALVRTSKAAANLKPLIIRVNEVGRADAVAYQDFAYKPQVPEIRYFLTQFVVGYYSRNHKTVAQQYVSSLYFLDRTLFSAIDARDRRTQWLPKFLGSAEDDVDVTVKNVIIEDLENQPYRARVEFTKIFTGQSGAESKRENWAGEFVFHISPDIPNQLILHNPLGLAITYFREDQAFNN
jgi:type IV secretory pathway TrbF-like protein